MLVLTTPYVEHGPSGEHFPSLHDYEIVNDNGHKVLVNVTVDGRREEFHELVFHDSTHPALEMRLFSFGTLMKDLSSAGFVEITDWKDCFPEFENSFPITARKP